MKVGFYLTGNDPNGYLFADRLIRSVRETMPGVQCVQFTDGYSAPVWGVDEVRRKPAATLSVLRSKHYADVDGEWLFVDTDVIIQKDVRHVFSNPMFAVAVTDRNWPHLRELGEFAEQMPYCAGVVFSRSKWFWEDVHKRVLAMPEKEQKWFGDQRALAEVIRTGDHPFVELSGSVYQYPPETNNDDLSHAAIVHYKGPDRKQLLINRIQKETFANSMPQTSKLLTESLTSTKAFVDEPLSKMEVKKSSTVLRVFIGYDPRQPVAFGVAAHSIARHSSHPVTITPLMLSQLPIRRRGLTEFTYSRFIVPYLCNYEGVSLFVDSDTLCRGDVHDLLAYAVAYPETAVFVVKGQLKFEWPSLMLFNNANCKNLTPAFVDDTTNAMFDFKWASSLGALPAAWNHLVGYDTPRTDAKLVHFTKGVPVWQQTANSEYGKEWLEEMARLGSSCSFQELMGNSVHVMA